MGYRWVQADPRIMPGWKHSGNSGSGSGKSRKTENVKKKHVTYQIKALGKLVIVVILEIRIFVFGIQKSPEKLEILEKIIWMAM